MTAARSGSMRARMSAHRPTPDPLGGQEVDVRPSSAPGLSGRHYLAATVAVLVGALLWWWVLAPRLGA